MVREIRLFSLGLASDLVEKSVELWLKIDPVLHPAHGGVVGKYIHWKFDYPVTKKVSGKIEPCNNLVSEYSINQAKRITITSRDKLQEKSNSERLSLSLSLSS